jgi:hypothetical protein
MKISQPFEYDSQAYRIELTGIEAGAIINTLAKALKGEAIYGRNITWVEDHVTYDKIQFIIEEESSKV